MVRMVVISFLIWIGLSIINIPYALVLGIFCGVLNIIPFLGPWLGAIPAAIIAVVTGNSIWLVILVNGFGHSPSFNVANQLDSWEIRSAFDCVLLFDQEKNRVFEVKASH